MFGLSTFYERKSERKNFFNVKNLVFIKILIPGPVREKDKRRDEETVQQESQETSTKRVLQRPGEKGEGATRISVSEYMTVEGLQIEVDSWVDLQTFCDEIFYMDL